MLDILSRVEGCLTASMIAAALAPAAREDRATPKEQWPEGVTLSPRPGMRHLWLVCEAIMAKGGRITTDDLGRAWLDGVDPQNLEAFFPPGEEIPYRLLKAGMPACDVGRYGGPALAATFMVACQPIGLINAADPDRAAADASDAGCLYLRRRGSGYDWVAIVCAAVAEAMRYGATVETILQTALRTAAPELRAPLERALGLADKASDWPELCALLRREREEDCWNAPVRTAEGESVCAGLAILAATRGELEASLPASLATGAHVNSVAGVSLGLAGALGGIEAIPKQWAKLIERLAEKDKSPAPEVPKRMAAGLHGAIMQHRERQKKINGLMEAQMR